MSQRLLIASHNGKKLAELRALCRGLPLEVLGPEALPQGLPEVAETGANLLQNAALKAFSAAEAAARQLGPEVWALADDSGLEVDALDGAPGVHSARYAGAAGAAAARDAANVAKLLAALDGVPEDGRTARFLCVIVVARRDEILFAVEGRVEGRILHAPEGDGGFGYDPIFYHEESGRSFAALSAEEKAAVSHRGLAVARLRQVLERVLPDAD